MPFINFLLDLAGLLLWVNWRSVKFDPLVRAIPTTLAGTVRSADPRRARRWQLPVALVLLLLLRAWIYWRIGSLVNWTPSLNLIAVSVSLRSDYLLRAALFSILSFGLTLAVFYLSLLLLSIVNSRKGEDDPFQRLVRFHLGWLDRWPSPLKLLLPLVLAAATWLALNPLLCRQEILPPCASFLHRLEQAGTLGVSVYLTWKYLVVTVLALFLVNSYIYLGKHPFWNFLVLTSRNLLAPLNWLPLRIGKVDFAPILAIAIAIELPLYLELKLTALYSHLPL